MMKALVLNTIGESLQEKDLPVPAIGPNQLLVRVDACGVCRTDLHIFDGELTNPKLPLILGHEIVGTVEKIGNGNSNSNNFQIGDRVGIPWLGYTCGECFFCLNDQENLCDKAQFTGYTRDGGYAEYTVAEKKYCFQIPDKYDAVSMAPLLCAGLIGWRSYKFAGKFNRLGMYGFGVAAHILTQVAVHQDKEVYAFTRDGDKEGQLFARELGCKWAGGTSDKPEHELDAAIIFAPVGELVITALKNVRKGGTIVCGGIHMTDIPVIPYDYLWGERSIRSVANLTRVDAMEFLSIADQIRLNIYTNEYSLSDANQAISDFKQSKIKGAAVLRLKD